MNASDLRAALSQTLAALPKGGPVRKAAQMFLSECRRDCLAALGLDRGLARSLVRTYRRQLLWQLQALEAQCRSVAEKGVQDA
jgi:hypothetical protein